ncbi:MAG TPA: sugar ABC transporter permease, partial [Fimbriimonas sp.]
MNRRDDAKAALVFLAPYGVLFLLFVVSPLVYGFWISLHNWHVLSENTPFVGLANYATALQDDLFRIAMARTFLFVVLAVPAGNLISLLFAIGLNQDYRGTTLYKVAFYLPVVMSITVVAILWRWIYSAEFGLLNYYLHSLGALLGRVPVEWDWFRSVVAFFNGSFPWISSPKWAMPSIALLSVWWGAGGNMLIYLAAL